jgi:uncharacterized protein
LHSSHLGYIYGRITLRSSMAAQTATFASQEGFMKIRSICNCLLFFGGLCLVWSGNPRQLLAGQNYPSHVTVFGQSSAAPPSAQPIDPAKEADIRQLMDAAGMRDMVTRMMATLEQSMRPMFVRSLPPGAYRERLVELFFEKFHANSDPEHILNLVVPVYAHNFSDDDIKGLIQFFQSPLGKNWVSLQPKLESEVAPAARSWGAEVGRDSMKQVLEEHPELEEQLKAAAAAAHQH